MSAATGRAGTLFDYAVEQPEGFTVPDACQHFEWSRSQFTRAVRALRLILGSDEINLSVNAGIRAAEAVEACR